MQKWILMFFLCCITTSLISLTQEKKNNKLQQKELKRKKRKKEFQELYDPRNPLSAHSRHAAFDLEREQHPQTKFRQMESTQRKRARLNPHLAQHNNHENLHF